MTYSARIRDSIGVLRVFESNNIRVALRLAASYMRLDSPGGFELRYVHGAYDRRGLPTWLILGDRLTASIETA